MSKRLRRSVEMLCPHPEHHLVMTSTLYEAPRQQCSNCGALRGQSAPGKWSPWYRPSRWERRRAAALGLLLLVGCSAFEMPSETIEGLADYAQLQQLPQPGPRPASFECTLAGVTASGDEPHVTVFRAEGREPVYVYSEDAVTDVHMSGTRVVVVGDIFAVGDEWVRLGECE